MTNKFWKHAEITPDIVVYETKLYLVVVTPRLWREQARAETERNLNEYSLVNKLYGCVEGGSNNLPGVITTANVMQETYDMLMKKETQNATVVRFPSKDRPE